MMGGHLKASLEQLGGRGRMPRPAERCATERVAERLAGMEAGRKREVEPWDMFVAGVDLNDASALKPKALKRVIDEVWLHESSESLCAASVADGLARDRKSIDRTILHAYLRRFPRDHAGFPALAAGSDVAASRHDWPWRERGQRWHLWKPDRAPELLAQALLASEDPAVLLRETGLDEFADGGLMREALVAACANVAARKGADAETIGRRLITLFQRMKGGAALNGAVAYALLKPWIAATCSDAHQKAISTLLVAKLGDPRLKPAAWSALQADVANHMGGVADAGEAFAVLRRWLVQKAVREFFKIVAKTTDRQDQWKERTDFWLAYLDANLITDAWFALGGMAEREAKRFLDAEGLEFGRIQGQGADSSSSALLMTLGDLRIAEWSHNGRARFWNARRQKAPPMYQSVYFALVLRSMDSDRGYEPLSHNGYWQPKFARRIYERTGLQHPDHGAGW